MRARGRAAVLVLATICCLAAPRAESQAGFRITADNPNPLALAGSYRVRWECPGIAIDEGLTSLTWYYSANQDGSDRHRMSTDFGKYDFRQGFLNQWQVGGPFAFDWGVENEANRWFLRTGRGGSIVNNSAPPQDSVISMLVRPRGFSPTFGVQWRMQQKGGYFELLSQKNQLTFTCGARQVAAWRIPLIRSREWFWLEVGTRNLKREIETRIRIYDEDRENVLFSQSQPCRDEGLLKSGPFSLLPYADYAEVHIDRWDSRWMDGTNRGLQWITSGVPNGKYWIVAEIQSKGAPAQLSISNFQVEVRNAGQAALKK